MCKDTPKHKRDAKVRLEIKLRRLDGDYSRSFPPKRTSDELYTWYSHIDMTIGVTMVGKVNGNVFFDRDDFDSERVYDRTDE